MSIDVITTSDVLASANELLADHSALISKIRADQQHRRRALQIIHPTPHELLELPLISSPPRSPSPDEDDDETPPPSPLQNPRLVGQNLTAVKHARALRFLNYVPEEETIRNDYAQRYVDGGEWPQNWVLGAEPEHRFEEYPKQQRLLNLKKLAVNNHSLPPSYLHYTSLTVLNPCKFDAILIDPPFSSSFTWDNLQNLPIPSLAADPSFVFLWVGSGAGEGLERGRDILAKWGYRRCEDVVWVKTNKTTNEGPGTDPPTTSLLTRTKQHCLIGIRGTVRRSTDSWFVHCNVDTDVIIWEGDSTDPTRKPPEMYTLIENFCLGTRRLEVFGRPSSLRRGWVTVLSPGQQSHFPALEDGTVDVPGLEGGVATLWNRETWEQGVKELAGTGKPVVQMTQEIEALRPKSPVRGGGGGGPGGGGGGMMHDRGGIPNNPGSSQGMGHGGGVGGPMMNNRFNPGVGGNGQGFVSGGVGLGVRPVGGVGFGNTNMAMMGGGPMMGQGHQMGGPMAQGMLAMGMPQLMGQVGMEEMMAGGGPGGVAGAWSSAMAGLGLNPGMGMQNMNATGMMSQGNMGPNQGMSAGGVGMNMLGQHMGGAAGQQMPNQVGAQMPGMNTLGQGIPGMFNPAMSMGMNNWNGDQGQFGGMDGAEWNVDSVGMSGGGGLASGMVPMGGMGMPNGMMGGMNQMQGMNLQGNTMNMGQWAGNTNTTTTAGAGVPAQMQRQMSGGNRF